MKGNSSRRHLDSLAIPEGAYIEPYTPAPGSIISPSLGQPLAYVKVHATDDGTLTGKDKKGNPITDFPIAKGTNPYLFSEISSCSTSIWIIHDGILKSTQEILNTPLPGGE